VATLRALRTGLRALSAVSPALATRVAERFWFRIPRPRIGDKAQQFLARGERFELAVAGRPVAAWRWGSDPAAPTVIFVHGWGGYAAQFQALIEPLAAAGLQAVAFDAPSHGASGPSMLGAGRSTLFEFADALAAVARETPRIAAVVAHSGGCTAVAWALRSSADWQAPRMVFVSPMSSALRYMGIFQRMLGLSDEVMRRFRARTERQFAFRWEDMDVPRMAARMTPPPLLVVHDRDDRETSWQDGADIAAGWPGATLQTTTGLGHVRILRDPAVVDSVVAFLTA
jgi:pimeloyl-ACP methyl ester carboxylesterase